MVKSEYKDRCWGVLGDTHPRDIFFISHSIEHPSHWVLPVILCGQREGKDKGTENGIL